MSHSATPPTWDLFGKALVDFHRGGRCPPYYWRRSDNKLTEESIAAYFARYPDWSEFERAAASQVTGRVLDIGCGTGKHVLEFQERGLCATGLDISPLAIEVCRERGVADARCADPFRSSLLTETFDCITLFTNNLSLAGSRSRATAFLGSLRRLVRPTGTVVLTNLDVTHSTDERDVSYRTRRMKTGCPLGLITMRAEYAGLTGRWIRWLFLSPRELEEIATAAQWGVKDLGVVGTKYYAVLAMN